MMYRFIRILFILFLTPFILISCNNVSKNGKKAENGCPENSKFQVGAPGENDTMTHKQTEYYSFTPPAVESSGIISTPPPSDAIVLFNGKNLDGWVASNDTTKTANWSVDSINHTFTIKPTSGNKLLPGEGSIQTKKRFMDYQLHLEFRIPKEDSSKYRGQDYGNSGLFLSTHGKTKEGDFLHYELQILNSFNSKTYSNGQCGSIYKQNPPLVNVCKPAGAWQSYDVIWHAPRFNEDGMLLSPASVTAYQNGVLIQNHFILRGITLYVGFPYYEKHGPSPIGLQEHHHSVNFRNFWVREL